MKIIIAGGGDIGRSIAERLIQEGHDITIIEKETHLINRLQQELDALIIEGQAESLQTLLDAGIKEADMLLAVTRDDNVNILISQMARKINKAIKIISKITNSSQYFSPGILNITDFGIDKVIDPVFLTIDKIRTVIEYPNALEMNLYEGNKLNLVGIPVKRDFPYRNQSLAEINQKFSLFHNVRVVAISRGNELLIPTGKDILKFEDKVYLIGMARHLKSVFFSVFENHSSIRDIIISGGSELGVVLAKSLTRQGKKVILIEPDMEICRRISNHLQGVHIYQGSSTDQSIIRELDLNNACFIAASKDDEYNIIASVSAKRSGALKTVTIIRNSTLVPIVTSMSDLDSVFSPNVLTVGEILTISQSSNVLSVKPFSQIQAESIEISLSEQIKWLDRPISEINFPEGMIIGALIRNRKIQIPTGKTRFQAGDRLILFLLPGSTKKVLRFFEKSGPGKPVK